MCAANTNLSCRFRPLLLSNAFAIIFGALVVKSYRVHRIVNNPDMTKRCEQTHCTATTTAQLPYSFHVHRLLHNHMSACVHVT